jgi:hypothetical protein
MQDPILLYLNLLSHVANDFSAEFSQLHVFLKGFQPLISALKKSLACGKNRLARLSRQGLEDPDTQKEGFL